MYQFIIKKSEIYCALDSDKHYGLLGIMFYLETGKQNYVAGYIIG